MASAILAPRVRDVSEGLETNLMNGGNGNPKAGPKVHLCAHLYGIVSGFIFLSVPGGKARSLDCLWNWSTSLKPSLCFRDLLLLSP